ncbi:hypothetical protein [Scytonema sp. NUACC26]|uniref:hypothetical protein n=1 Tax=Scytonema sp. NUACC26 TaxID=3140176 RepID=UPI0034DBF125
MPNPYSPMQTSKIKERNLVVWSFVMHLKAGNVYGAAPEAVFIFAPDGTLLGTIETGVRTGNLAWGEDGHSLFITVNTAIYRIRLTATGEGYSRNDNR